MTTDVAAAELDTTRGQVARLCREGKLKATRKPHQGRMEWDVHGASVRKLRDARFKAAAKRAVRAKRS